MKKILFTLVGLLIAGLFASSLIQKQNTPQTIVIESVNKNIALESLKESSLVMSNRLTDYGCDSFHMEINKKERTINVTLKNNENLSTIKRLITKRGAMSFYETIDRREFISSFIDSRIILSRFNGNAKKTEVIGCSSKFKKRRINKYLKKIGLDNYFKFAWSARPNDKDYSLYALNVKNNNQCFVRAEDMEGLTLQKIDQDLQNIKLKFNAKATMICADSLRFRIYRSVAVLIDDQVYFTSNISKNSHVLSGNLKEKEMRFFKAIANNKELPDDFKIVW